MLSSSSVWALMALLTIGAAMDLERSKTVTEGFRRSARSPFHLKKHHHKRQVPGECGREYGGDHGIIHSPNYPDEYDNNLSCSWTIRGPHPDSTIELEFADLKLEANSDDGECYDSLVVTTGLGDALGTFCGYQTPPPLISTDGVMRLTMYSDSSVTYQGFSAHYEITDNNPPINACGGRRTRPRGTIQSPNYPNNYDNNEECEWTIEAPPGTVIQLTFTDFRIEIPNDDGECYADKLDITESNGDSLATVCGKTVPDPITSTTNRVNLRFTSDYSLGFLGFNIEYEVTDPGSCGGVLTYSEGTITTPNYPSDYNNDDNCEWTIRGPSGSIVALAFDDFSTEDCLDRLIVYDGPVEMDPLCGRSTPSPIATRNNVVRLSFRTDSSVTYSGFSLRYNIIN